MYNKRFTAVLVIGRFVGHVQQTFNVKSKSSYAIVTKSLNYRHFSNDNHKTKLEIQESQSKGLNSSTLKIIAISSLIATITYVYFYFTPDDESAEQSDSDDRKWNQYKQKFNKKYDEKEDRLRKTIFLETITKIDHFNHSGNHSYTQGIDEFTDWSLEECRVRYGHRPRQSTADGPTITIPNSQNNQKTS